MPSNNHPNQNEPAANSSPTDGKSRLPLASCALVAVFALATAAGGAGRMDLSGGFEDTSASRLGGEAAHGYGLATVVRQRVARAVGVPPASERRYVPAEVLVHLAPNVPDRAVAALARRLRLDRIASATAGDVTVLRWRIPDQRSVPAVIRSLEAERIVLAAQPNYLYGPAAEGVRAGEQPAMGAAMMSAYLGTPGSAGPLAAGTGRNGSRDAGGSMCGTQGFQR